MESIPAHVQLQPVESSNIKATARDGDHLYVQFKDGAAYRYTALNDKHRESLDALSGANSIGAHVARIVRPQMPGVRVQANDGNTTVETPQ
jgi:phage baseplate assembly protein gpV